MQWSCTQAEAIYQKVRQFISLFTPLPPPVPNDILHEHDNHRPKREANNIQDKLPTPSNKHSGSELKLFMKGMLRTDLALKLQQLRGKPGLNT